MKKLMLASTVCSAIAGATIVSPVTAMASPAIATAVAVEAAKNVLPNVEVETRMFSPSFDTKVHSDSINYNGGDVSLKNDLGFDNKKGPEFIVRYRNMSLDWIHACSYPDGWRRRRCYACSWAWRIREYQRTASCKLRTYL